MFRNMNQQEVFKVGFGNERGQTTLVMLQQRKNRIQIANIKSTQIENPKISIKKYPEIPLGPLRECIRKRRDENVLKQLLKVQVDFNLNQIEAQCQTLDDKIANDLLFVNAMIQEANLDRFMARTKSNQKQAQKYLSKHPNLEEAVRVYQKHQEIIAKFMKQNQCDRENALNFLESNNFDESLF